MNCPLASGRQSASAAVGVKIPAPTRAVPSNRDRLELKRLNILYFPFDRARGGALPVPANFAATICCGPSPAQGFWIRIQALRGGDPIIFNQSNNSHMLSSFAEARL